MWTTSITVFEEKKRRKPFEMRLMGKSCHLSTKGFEKGIVEKIGKGIRFF